MIEDWWDVVTGVGEVTSACPVSDRKFTNEGDGGSGGICGVITDGGAVGGGGTSGRWGISGGVLMAVAQGVGPEGTVSGGGMSKGNGNGGRQNRSCGRRRRSHWW